jgi:hypothetical protein
MQKDLRQRIKDELAKSSAFTQLLNFRLLVIQEVNRNDINSIKNLLNPNNYIYITLAKKEELIFKYTCRCFNFEGSCKEILNYLIFDYKISEANSLGKETEADAKNWFCADEVVRKMFDSRKLNQELNLSLEVNELEDIKFIKV